VYICSVLFYIEGLQVLGSCWKEIVCMDVTFREFVPYYTNKDDLDQFLEEFSSVTESDSREGENNYGHSSGDCWNNSIIPCK
jgi:hypothetical protein